MTLADYRAEMDVLRKKFVAETVALLNRAQADGFHGGDVTSEVEPIRKAKPVRRKKQEFNEYDL